METTCCPRPDTREKFIKGSREGLDTLGQWKGNVPSIWGGGSVERYETCRSGDQGWGAEPRAVLFLSVAPLKRSLAPESSQVHSVTLFTFGFLEQLFCELDHLDYLDPREAFAHSKDDTVVEGVQQYAPARIP